MKEKIKKWLPALFALLGALLGLAYYYIIGCANGTCPITANPVATMVYMGIVGLLIGGIFKKEDSCGCNM